MYSYYMSNLSKNTEFPPQVRIGEVLVYWIVAIRLYPVNWQVGICRQPRYTYHNRRTRNSGGIIRGKG